MVGALGLYADQAYLFPDVDSTLLENETTPQEPPPTHAENVWSRRFPSESHHCSCYRHGTHLSSDDSAGACTWSTVSVQNVPVRLFAPGRSFERSRDGLMESCRHRRPASRLTPPPGPGITLSRDGITWWMAGGARQSALVILFLQSITLAVVSTVAFKKLNVGFDPVPYSWSGQVRLVLGTFNKGTINFCTCVLFAFTICTNVSVNIPDQSNLLNEMFFS